MKKLIVTAAAIGALSAAGLGLAGGANAAPFGGTSADDTVSTLESQGFDVVLNGSANVPLSRCLVTDVHGLPASNAFPPATFTRVFVDVSCPSHD